MKITDCLKITLTGFLICALMACTQVANSNVLNSWTPSPSTIIPTMSSPTGQIIPPAIETNPILMSPEPIVQSLILRAKTSLAAKINTSVDRITLSEVNAVQWTDSSLGCPRPGVTYTEVITPGYQIQLEAEGKVFIFHTDNRDRVILCDARPPDEIFLPP